MIEIGASISAKGGVSAVAEDFDLFLLHQFVAGRTANDVLTNDGTMALAGHAVANADDFAWALLTLAAPVAQSAVASTSGGHASATIANHVLSIAASVDAHGGSQALAELLIGTVSSGAAVAQIANGDVAKVSLTNSGALSLLARAGATATGFATASVDIGAAIAQAALGVANADASMVNQGSIVVDAEAIAKGGTNAVAVAHVGDRQGAITQAASAFATQSAFFSNAGTIQIAGHASASATGAAGVSAAVKGVAQSVIGEDSKGTAVNDGEIDLVAVATAAGSAAIANASATNGLVQQLIFASTPTAMASNVGTIELLAAGSAIGEKNAAFASAKVAKALGQFLGADGDVDVTLVNDGTIVEAAQAFASGAGGALGTSTFAGSAVAFAVASAAMIQRAQAIGPFTAEMDNSGPLTVMAGAIAVGQGIQSDEQQGDGGLAASPSEAATAVASALGMLQLSFRTFGPRDFTMANSGVINVDATASAKSGDRAFANAIATGAVQSGVFGTDGAAYTFTNKGTLNVGAQAKALVELGSGETALATATGYVAFTSDSLTIDALNDGTINVSAQASAPHGVGMAVAEGLHVRGAPVFDSSPASIAGTIENSGTINVLAEALGTRTTHVVFSTPGVPSETLGGASAAGIFAEAGTLDLTITNSGTINVAAIGKGVPATAYGIRVDELPLAHLAATEDRLRRRPSSRAV